MNLSGPLPHLRKLTDMDTLADFTFTPTTKAPEPDLGLELIPVDRYTDPAFLNGRPNSLTSSYLASRRC